MSSPADVTELRGPPVRRPRLSRDALVWAYVAALAAAAVALWTLTAWGRPALLEPHVAWWAIALGFVVAEACVVHLQFRRSTESFSLADVPLVLALTFAASEALLAGALVGTAIVHAARRIAPVKLAFNVAQLAVSTAVAVVLFRGIAGDDDSLGPQTWLALYAAMLTTGVLTIACIAVAIAIAEERLRLAAVREMVAFDLTVTTTNTSLAIVAAIVIAADERAVAVLLVPLAAVYAMYRVWVSERRRHERLEFLYEANRSLSRSPEVAEAIEGLLMRSLDAFHSEIAEVVLLGTDGPSLRTTHGPGDERVTMQPVDPAIAADLVRLADPAHPVASVAAPFPDTLLGRHLAARGIREAMVALLSGDERTIGVLLLANRVGLERAYAPDDLRLLEALANNASAALQYDRLEQAVAQLRTLQQELHHQASHDPLTDLPNRALFMERLRDAVAAGSGAGVMFIDVDDFKIVNDSLGHAVGDALLVEVGARLRACVRPGDVVARLGGDEFAILLPAVEAPAVQARRVAARILDAFRMPVSAGSALVAVHVSIGIAEGLRGGADADELVRRADVAMYAAKAKGKGGAEAFHPSMAEDMVRRHDLKAELAKALEREQITVQYQPIVALHDSRIVGAEALVRWEHPVRGLVPPAHFVPLAEETGLIVALGRYVLTEACRQARRWEEADRGEPALRMHVNLSVAELRDPELVAHVLGCVERAGIRPEQLALEITETQLLADDRHAARFEDLRAQGVRVALDDFGTGYSSLSYLQALPLDVLKIAKPFVDQLAPGEGDAGFVAMIVDLARRLELEVVAEGIETREQLAALRALGVDLGQGFLLGRPSAAAPGPLDRRSARVA